MWYIIAKKESNKQIHKGLQKISGISVSIEFLKGDTRTKTDSEGKTWSRIMKAPYGHIPKTEGVDGDCVDVFIGNDLKSKNAYIINQTTEDGKFDEHKCVMGCKTIEDAKELYLANYPKDWKCGEIIEMSINEFKDWLKDGDTSKPVNKKTLK